MTKIIRNLLETLGMLSRGAFAEKCDEHFAAALTALESLPGEKGTATITMTLTLVFDSGRVDIRPTIKSKLPEEKAFSGTPFWTLEGGLSTQHPSQHDMFAGPRSIEPRSRMAD